MTEYNETEEKQIEPIPEAELGIEPVEQEEEEEVTSEAVASLEKPEEKDELADLFEVPQPDDNDMTIDHLFLSEEEDDMSDLTEVSTEDIMGEEEAKPAIKERRVARRFKRVPRRYTPPTSIGGLNV